MYVYIYINLSVLPVVFPCFMTVSFLLQKAGLYGIDYIETVICVKPKHNLFQYRGPYRKHWKCCSTSYWLSDFTVCPLEPKVKGHRYCTKWHYLQAPSTACTRLVLSCFFLWRHKICSGQEWVKMWDGHGIQMQHVLGKKKWESGLNFALAIRNTSRVWF